MRSPEAGRGRAAPGLSQPEPLHAPRSPARRRIEGESRDLETYDPLDADGPSEGSRSPGPSAAFDLDSDGDVDNTDFVGNVGLGFTGFRQRFGQFA